jgi:hypothetical protein
MIRKTRHHWPWTVGARWRWGGGEEVPGTGGGEGWGLGTKGRGVAYFLPQTSADIYHIGVFQKYAFWA